MDAIPRYVPGRREYGVKTWLRMLYLLIGVGFVAFSVTLGPVLLHSPGNALPAALPALFLLGCAIYMLATVVRSRLVIDGTRIEVRTAFRDRSADVSEIEGFRTIRSRNGNYTWLKLREGRGAINIPYTFDVDEDFRAWLRQVPDLDQKDRDEILGEVAQRQDLGATPEERLAALPTARTWAVFLAVVTGVAAVALAFGPQALHPFAVVIFVVTPIAAAMLLHRSPLLYAVMKQKSDPRAELLYVLMIAGFGLLFHASGLHLVRFQPLLLVATPVAAAAFFGFTAPPRGASNRPGAWFALAMLSCLYGFALSIVTDTVGDSRIAATYRAEVLGKHESHGRSTSYTLSLAPWGPRELPDSVGVSSTTYRLLDIGDQACIEVHPGNLRITWFRVAACTQGFPAEAP
ncbi:MAG: hypothetical protein P4L40_15740 [Terracidiphilus sp.]|nr:hypothetical protein [Terracidiphilus sp.]